MERNYKNMEETKPKCGKNPKNMEENPSKSGKKIEKYESRGCQ